MNLLLAVVIICGATLAVAYLYRRYVLRQRPAFTAGDHAVTAVLLVLLGVAFAADGHLLGAVLGAAGALLAAYYAGVTGRVASALATGPLVAAAVAVAEHEPTCVLVPEPVTGPFAGRVYRALPDVVAQAEGHQRGLIVFLDDAERILSDGQTAAYAEGRSDQAIDDRLDDPEQTDAEAAQCTGLTATWCPVCGDCSCVRREHDGGFNHQDDPDCPLHGTDSPHATETPGQSFDTSALGWQVRLISPPPGRENLDATIVRIVLTADATDIYLRWPDRTVEDGPYSPSELAGSVR